MFKIIIDSTCDLAQDILDQYDIKMLSLMVNVDGQSYRDKKEITTQETHQKISENVDIKTSLPFGEDIYTLFKEYASQGIDFIYLAFSSKLSGTYNLAYGILEELKQEYPNTRMEIVDTKTGGIGINLIVQEMLKKREETNNYDETLKLAQYLSNHIKFYFMVNDLSQLAKGSRISKTIASLANSLHIRPILLVEDGEIKSFAKTRGTKKALMKLASIIKETSYNSKQTLAINYSNNKQLADDIHDILKDKEGFNNFIYQPIGSVLSIHIGLDAVGVALFDEYNI